MPIGKHKALESKLKKKSKDPNAPKKPSSAYIMFFRHRRKDLLKDQPDLKPMDVTRVLGKEWRELPPEKQKVDSQQDLSETSRFP